MTFTVLYDNSTRDPSILSGWGFSCLIDGRILFDTGEAPDSLFHNMERLNTNPEKIEAVVISHDHWDHTGGLWELLKKRKGLRVYACPGFSSEFKKQVDALEGTLIESGDYREINAQISVTGEIPGQYKGTPMPEQALIVKTGAGISIITGCSHPGIVAMVEKAKEIFPDLPISLVLGGFHLMNENPETIDSVASALMKMGVHQVGPTHCTGEIARTIFQKHFGGRYIPVFTGKQLNL
jgi:7,8-dihydropterin-6-yl-methyl-4-(beta-D-ribofuranosyl)aminobenzene 5'-phosphate synthase